jgi:putative transposase
MREHHFLVSPHRQLQAQRPPMRSQPRPTKPTAWWGIGMTKVLVQGVGWVYSVVVLDWSTKVMVGYAAGLQCKAQDWLSAVDLAVNCLFPAGVRQQGLGLLSADGCEPTALAFMRTCATVESPQAFTRDTNPQGNADTERCIRMPKEECLWLQDWTCPLAHVSALETEIDDDNAHDLHSALGSKTPRQVEREYNASHSPPFVAA